MSLDDRIRRGLSSIADQTHPDALAARPGMERRRRRKVAARAATMTLATGMAVATAIVVPVTLLNGTGDPTLVDPASPGPVAAVPGSFLVANGTSVDLYSTESGNKIRTVYRDERYAIQGMSLSRDRQTVFIGREKLPLGDVAPAVEIVSVTVNGGEPVRVAEGHSPAVGPTDQEILAYVGRGETTETSDGELRCYSREPIVLHDDLARGARTTIPWTVPDGAESDPYQVCNGPNDLSWSPDGGALAYSRNVGDPFEEVHVITHTGGSDGAWVEQLVASDRSFRDPVFTADGDLLVVEDLDVHGANPRSRIVAVDGETLQAGETLYAADGFIWSVAYDASFGHLIVTEPDACGRGCMRVSRWTGAGLEPIAEIEVGSDEVAEAIW